MAEAQVKAPLRRQPMPHYRGGIIESFRVGVRGEGALEGYLITGMRDDGSGPGGGPAFGEMFTQTRPTGSASDDALVSGLLDALSQAVTVAVQHGVPVEAFVECMTKTSFEPSGPTDDPQIPHARSVVDYLFSRIALSYLDEKTCRELGVRSAPAVAQSADLHFEPSPSAHDEQVLNSPSVGSADAHPMTGPARGSASVSTLSTRGSSAPARAGRRTRIAHRPSGSHLGASA